VLKQLSRFLLLLLQVYGLLVNIVALYLEVNYVVLRKEVLLLQFLLREFRRRSLLLEYLNQSPSYLEMGNRLNLCDLILAKLQRLLILLKGFFEKTPTLDIHIAHFDALTGLHHLLFFNLSVFNLLNLT
jgi:hypothetical protein